MPGASRALALLALALVCAMATWFSASAVIPQLRADWGLSRSAASWLTIAVQLGFVAGALGSSVVNLSDVVPPRLVIFGGAVGAAAGNGLLALAHGAAAAIPLRFATGLFLAGVYPPALKLMATWFRRGRGTALGILVGALTLGSASPHLVNGLGGIGWRTVIVVTSLLTLAGGLIALLAVPEGPFPFPRAVVDPRQIHAVFANRGVRLSSLGYFGHMWELYAMWAWFLVFASEALFSSRTAAALTTFAVIGVGALGCVVGGMLGDRIGRAETTAGLMVCSGLCALTIGLLPTWAAVVVALVWGFTVIADSAQFSTLVTEHAEQAYVGTALALQLAVGFTLTVATIWLIPIVRDAVGWRWAFSILAVGPALGVVAMLRLRRADRAER
ncbi:MAG TPA: MFS transporter [Gaiellaceae bacterium]|nr:MFS transporter [Gaiellaceae bacterium]